MRVTYIGHNEQTASLRCIVTGFSCTAHIERCKVIRKPLTEALMNDWGRVITSEGSVYRELFRSDQLNINRNIQAPSESSNNPRPASRGRNVAFTTPYSPDEGQPQPLPDHLLDSDPVIYIDDWQANPEQLQENNAASITRQQWEYEVAQFVSCAHLVFAIDVEDDPQQQ